MKIFLDDKRDLKMKTGFQIVQTYQDCVLWIDIANKNNGIDFISLDYDLSDAKYTGLSILEYMSKNKIVPKHINIHSDHQNGVAEMRKYCRIYFQDTKLTFNAV